MQIKKTIVTLALAVVALVSMTSRAVADSVPEYYRAIFQWAVPLSKESVYTGAAGAAINTGYEAAPGTDIGTSNPFLLVPGGYQRVVNENYWWYVYLMLVEEINRDITVGGEKSDLSNTLEVRTVMGLDLHTNIAPDVEIGVLSRYESRFKNVTEDVDFETRLRMRPWIDFTFLRNPEKGTAWHAQLEVEGKYVIGEDDSGKDYAFLNAVMPRVVIGYKISETLMVDLKYTYEMGRSDSGADWEQSYDAFTIQFVKNFGTGPLAAGKAPPADY